MMTLMLQGPCWSEAQRDNFPEQFTMEVYGVDIDYGALTVYLDGVSGDNLTLANSGAPMMNECGDLIGDKGWLIEPDPLLLAARPELGAIVGAVYGRPIAYGKD